MIDIIITTYNSRDTLEKTLESIYIQKNMKELCIYIVDDGSTCDYNDILEKYKDKLNITFKKNTENRGPGAARNDALSISKNDYIIFIDSDDIFYNEKSIYNLYSKITETNSDIVTSVVKEELGNEYKLYENELIGLHGKIYRRRKIEENNIRFIEKYCNEDYYFNSLLRLYDSKIENINEITYIWKENNNSLTRKKKEEHLEIDCLEYSNSSIEALKTVLKKDYINNDLIIDYCCRSIVDINYKLELINNSTIINKTLNNVNKIIHIFKRISTVEDIINYLIENNYINENECEILKWMINECNYRNRQLSNYQRSKTNRVYYPLDDEFKDIRLKHLGLMKRFNQMNQFDYYNPERIEILKKMFGYYDYSSIVEPPIDSNWGCKNVYIGKDVFINSNVFFEDDADIVIGNNVKVGKGVHFITVNHMISPILRKQNLIISKEINIKDDVWIGSNVTILPGVTIGKNSVIASGSVVVKDIPDNVIAAGNPCKVIRKISLYDELFINDEIIDL